MNSPTIAPRCEHYAGTDRCHHPAVYQVAAPGGMICGNLCRRHGQEVVTEYREKLGESWRLIQPDAWHPGKVKA